MLGEEVNLKVGPELLVVVGSELVVVDWKWMGMGMEVEVRLLEHLVKEEVMQEVLMGL